MRKLVLVCLALLSINTFACDCSKSKVVEKSSKSGCGCKTCDAKKSA